MFEYPATWLRAHDGDTMRFRVDLGFDLSLMQLDVRLLGIDCPELGRPDGLGEKARDFVVAWFGARPGGCVLRTKKDHVEKYGRYLAEVQVGTDLLIADLLAAGLALPYSGHGPRPVWPLTEGE